MPKHRLILIRSGPQPEKVTLADRTAGNYARGHLVGAPCVV